ncbi:MAG: hypothetical protein LBR92_00435 [Puniceicoccales bacterium]|jgi:hypothetical protein|nr:hypothetical protein [Puniceicoccales bacterium]
MKKTNQLKVVLPLIIGLSGVVQGSSNDDLQDDVEVDTSAVAMHPVRQEPIPEEEQVYLFYDAGFDWLIFSSSRFIFVDGKGEPIFFPEMELADFLRKAKCFALPRCLFKRIASKEICSSMEATYGDSEIGDKIRKRAEREKDRLCMEPEKGHPFMILMKEGWTNGSLFTMVDSRTDELYDSIPSEVDMKAVYRVEVSETLYKKLMSRTFGQKIENVLWTAHQAVGLFVCYVCAPTLLGALGYGCLKAAFGF